MSEERLNINDFAKEPEVQIPPVQIGRGEFPTVSESIAEDAGIYLRGRPDSKGKVKRIEGDNVVLSIFDETYSVPYNDFTNLFDLTDNSQHSNWYRRHK